MARHATVVEPAPGKERFAALIDAQCRRLELVDALGQPDRRALSVRCALGATTLNRLIARPLRPSLNTLLALEETTGVPVDEWREALGLLARPAVRPETLSPAERRLLEFARQRGDAWINRTVAWLEAAESPLAIRSDHAGSPSSGEGT